MQITLNRWPPLGKYVPTPMVHNMNFRSSFFELLLDFVTLKKTSVPNHSRLAVVLNFSEQMGDTRDGVVKQKTGATLDPCLSEELPNRIIYCPPLQNQTWADE